MNVFPFRFGFENIFNDETRTFSKRYTCYSVSLLPGNERDDVERGGKIIMPPSALEQLTRFNASYPMLFKLTNPKVNKTTHCGVLEFVADENNIYIPYWMMLNLLLDEGDEVAIESIKLPVGTYSKFQPKLSAFLDISNPKAVLENSLRNFACLSKGDLIAIRYNSTTYELSVLETQPGDAISIIECDMNVEFTTPVDYKPEHVEKKQKTEEEDLSKLMPPPKGFLAFSGGYSRLDGKICKEDELNVAKPVYERGIPDYNYKLNTLKFIRTPKPAEKKQEPAKEEFTAFAGKGISLRDSKIN